MTRETFLRVAPVLVTLVIVAVGLYDAVIGVFLLTSETPWAAHGPGTLWHDLPADPATTSLFRRMGAFSLHAGVVTVAWGALAWRRPELRTALFAIYLVTGLGFFWTDQTFFEGTGYLAVKTGIGTVFAAAFAVHVAWLLTRREAAPA